MITFAAVGLVGCGGGGSETGAGEVLRGHEEGGAPRSAARHVDWFVNRGAGYRVLVPSGWSVARQRLAELIIPTEILSMGTFPMRPTVGSCGGMPRRAVFAMKPSDAFVSVQDHHFYNPRNFPLRPAHFQSQPGRIECITRRGFESSFIPFSDSHRSFYAILVLGRRAPRAQALEILDSFDPSVRWRPRVASRGRLPHFRGSPLIALDCPKGNSYRCDRIFFFFALRKAASRLSASVAGRPVIDLRTAPMAPGSGARTGKRGFVWSGYVQPAGLTRRGSPIELRTKGDYWAGRPPVRARVRVVAEFRDGRIVSQVFPSVLLRAGHG